MKGQLSYTLYVLQFCGRYGAYDTMRIAYNVFQSEHYTEWV